MHTTRGAPQSRQLSFAERVAYQYAIEEVYWRHRIWPKENPGPKPSLDEVMSRTEIEKKVEDYLRNSQLLADQRRQPITSADLQAEMDRMASHTKQPDVLRELFAALNNDPFVIAECLARPILAARLAENDGGSSAPICQSGSDLAAKPNREAIKNSWPAAVNGMARGAVAPPDIAYALPEISVPLDCTDDTWTATSTTNAPNARDSHTAVWTGSEMIVWGGYNGSYFNTGGRYIPATDSWTATITANAPTARGGHTAVWTGSEMIVWGGYYLTNTGGRYNPATNSWIATSLTNAPGVRYGHAAAWTGSEMIIWGGTDNKNHFNTGARYNPSSDIWIATSITNAPTGRESFTVAWTGSEMIVWGGYNGTSDSNTGGRYNPSTDSWMATSITNAASARDSHTAVWTGSEMIVWGGLNGGAFQTTGGRYNPSTDSWTPTSIPVVPYRYDHTAVWTGTQMIIWGGYDISNYANTGGRYTPSTDSWTITSTSNAPDGRTHHTAVWTGSQMIVWGGHNVPGYFNTGGRYCAQPSAPLVQSAVSRKTHGGAGDFDVNLPLTGTPGIECRNGGATNDYTIVVTFLANVSVNGNPQAAVTAGTGTIGSNGMSNGGMVTISGNVVTIPLTNVGNAQTINVTLNGVNGSTNVTIPMSILIGDTNGNRTVNAADVAQTKSRLGQTVNATNFRSDVNANGSINAADTAIVKQNSGTSLPP